MTIIKIFEKCINCDLFYPKNYPKSKSNKCILKNNDDKRYLCWYYNNDKEIEACEEAKQ